MYNVVNTLVPSFFIGSSLFLQVTRTIIKSGLSSKFSLMGSYVAELAALELLKNSPYTYNWRNVNTLVPSFFICSSSFMQETRTCIKTWMRLNINQIQPLTMEVPAYEHLKNQCIML